MKTPRSWLVARCCGMHYKRWATGARAGVSHTACARCGAALVYSLPAPDHAKRDAQRAANLAQGLTARGTERKYQYAVGNFKTVASAANAKRSESKISAQTHRRIVGIRREHAAESPRKLSATDVAWKQFRGGLGDISIPSFGDHNAFNGKDRK